MSMLDDNKFDELFRNSFEEGNLPVSEQLLNNIKTELGIGEKRKRRVAWWIWLLGGAGLALVIFGAVYFGGSLSHESDSKIVEVEKTISADDNKNRRNKSAGSLDNKIEPVLESSKVPDDVAAHKAQNSDVESAQSVTSVSFENTGKDARLNDKQDNQQVQLAKKKQNVGGDIEHRNDLNKNTIGTDPVASTNTNKNNTGTAKTLGVMEHADAASEKDIPSKAKKQNDESGAPQTKLNGSLNRSTENKKDALKNNNGEDNTKSFAENGLAGAGSKDSSEQVADKIKETQKEPGTKQFMDSLLTKKDSLIEDKQNEKLDSLARNKETRALAPEKLKETNDKKSIAYFVEANGGLSQSFRVLNTGVVFTLENRDKEIPWLTYGAGVDVGLILKNKYQLSVGLGLDNKGEKYSYGGQNALMGSHIQDVQIGYDTIPVVDSLNDTTYYYEPIYAQDTITFIEKPAVESKTITNKYHYVKLPVMFGYRFNVSEKLFVTPNVGVVFNFLAGASATWFDSDSQQYIIYDTRKKYTALVFAARAKIDIGYNINNKWSILLQPGYTRYLNSIYRKDENFKQYPYSYDCNLGIRYSF